MNFSVTGMVQQVLPAMGLKKWSGGAFLFLKRVSNDQYIYIYTFSRYDMQRNLIQIWFWAMTNKCIMNLKPDWTYLQSMFQYSTHEETR